METMVPISAATDAEPDSAQAFLDKYIGAALRG